MRFIDDHGVRVLKKIWTTATTQPAWLYVGGAVSCVLLVTGFLHEILAYALGIWMRVLGYISEITGLEMVGSFFVVYGVAIGVDLIVRYLRRG